MSDWQLTPERSTLARWLVAVAVAIPLVETAVYAAVAAVSVWTAATVPTWAGGLSPWVAMFVDPDLFAAGGLLALPLVYVPVVLAAAETEWGPTRLTALRVGDVVRAAAVVAPVAVLSHAALVGAVALVPGLRFVGFLAPVVLVGLVGYLGTAVAIVDLQGGEDPFAPGDLTRPDVLVAAGIVALVVGGFGAVMLFGVVLLLGLVLVQTPAGVPYLTLVVSASGLALLAAEWLAIPRSADPSLGTVTVGDLTVRAGDVAAVRRLRVADVTLLALSLSGHRQRSWVVVPLPTVDELAVQRLLPDEAAVSQVLETGWRDRLRRRGALAAGIAALAGLGALGARIALDAGAVGPLGAIPPALAIPVAAPVAVAALWLLDYAREDE